MDSLSSDYLDDLKASSAAFLTGAQVEKIGMTKINSLKDDCCGATDFGNHLAAIKMIKMQGGVFGAVASSSLFLEHLP